MATTATIRVNRDTFWGLNVPPSIRSHLIEVNGLIFDPWSDTGNTLGTGVETREEEVETLRRRPRRVTHTPTAILHGQSEW
jgi:hypothetical protein